MSSAPVLTPQAARLHAELARAPDPMSGGVWSRFTRGLGYPWAGWHFVRAHPELKPLCVIPVLLNLAIVATITYVLYRYYPDLVGLIWKKPQNLGLRILWHVMYLFMIGAGVVVGFLLFYLLQGLLAAPFNDLLSERTERILAGHAPLPFSLKRFLRNLAVTVGHESLKFLMLGSILAALWLFCMIVLPGFGSLVFSVLGGAVSAFFLGYDYHDYALSRRRFRVRAKWRMLRANTAMTLGFGTAVAAMLLVPVFGLLFPPFAAVGGTILCLDYERYGRLPPPPPQ
jgi:CysZ protein